MAAERERALFNLRNGWDAMNANRFRAVLTSLGIIFGVAAVIAMLAIGNGAEKEILEQIRQIGSNNIIINSKIPKENPNDDQALSQGSNIEKPKFSPGLSLADVRNLQSGIPGVASVSPQVEQEMTVYAQGKKLKVKIIGVDNAYFRINNLNVAQGQAFSEAQQLGSAPVCIIGKGVQTKLFADVEALGLPLKAGENWFKIQGILEDRSLNKGADKLQIRDVNLEVFVPIQSFLIRIQNRSEITLAEIKRFQESQENSEEEGGTSKPKVDFNYHQIDRITVNMHDSKDLPAAVKVIEKMLQRRHNQVADYEIVVPELLLKQEQKTRNLFNLVLAVIAGISLLVGGIGIMNIMLASVMERIKEIGLRLALGARKNDIVQQFLAEAIVISLSGGILGIILGVVFSYAIEWFADIQTLISPASVLVSFVVSVSVGLLFGIYPARRAAAQNPIESLRYE